MNPGCVYRFCAIWLLAELRYLEPALNLKGSHNKISLTNMTSFCSVHSILRVKHTLYLKNNSTNSSLILLKLFYWSTHSFWNYYCEKLQTIKLIKVVLPWPIKDRNCFTCYMCNVKAINCHQLYTYYFCQVFWFKCRRKKTFCEERNLLVCTRTAYLSDCEHELNKKLIWVDLTCIYVKRKARRKEIQKWLQCYSKL